MIFCTAAGTFSLSAFSRDFGVENGRIQLTKDRKNCDWIAGGESSPAARIWLARHPDAVMTHHPGEGLRVDISKAKLNGMAFSVFCPLPRTESAPERFRSKLVRAIVSWKAERGAEGIVIVFYRDKNKKRAGKSKRFGIRGDFSDAKLEALLPEDLSSVEAVSVGFFTPGVYTLRSIRLEAETPPDVALPAGNQLLNGGAERGWLETCSFPKSLRAVTPRDHSGRPVTFDRIIALDGRISHSGKYSFRVTSKPNAGNRLYIGPFRYAYGKPLRVSFWAKADRPNVSSGIFLSMNSGAAAGFPESALKIGTEWTRISLLVPSWGDPIPGGGQCIGLKGNANVHNEGYLVLSPQTESTVWYDDISISIGREDLPYRENDFAVSGFMNKPEGYYFPGEAVAGTFTVSNLTARPADYTFEAKLLDFRGNTCRTLDPGRISVAAGGEKSFSVPLKEPLFGAQNLVVTVRDSATGKTQEHGLLFGGLRSRGGALVKRLGLDLSDDSSPVLMIELFRTLRCGTARLWGSLGSERHRGETSPAFALAGPLHDAGVRTMLNFGAVGMKNACLPRDPAPSAAEWRRQFAAHGKTIDIFELFNEPNIWKGRVVDPEHFETVSAAAYLKYLKVCRSVLDETAPHGKIAGPTVCTADVSWIAQVLHLGGGRYLDYLSMHPYCDVPEDYELAERLREIGQEGRRLVPGKKLPVLATESGKQYSQILRNNRIDEKSRRCMAEDLRAMLLAFSGGAECYVQFKCNPSPHGTTWNILAGGNPDNRSLPVLLPIAYGIRTMADMIGDFPHVANVRLGEENRGMIFDRGTDRVAVLWKWRGKPVCPDARTLEKTGTFYDVMGNAFPPGGLLLDEYPVYYTTSLAAPSLARALESLDIPMDQEPCRIECRATDAGHFMVSAQNRSNRPCDISLTVRKADGERPMLLAAVLSPGERKEWRIPSSRPLNRIPQPVSVSLRSSGRISEHRFSLTAIPVPKVRGPLNAAGFPVEWKDVPAILLNASEHGIRRNPELWGAADGRISADVRLQWSPDALYGRVSVFKPKHFDRADNPGQIWETDSIQLAFDPLSNSDSGKPGYRDDDFEYTLGLWRGNPVVSRHFASSSKYDSLAKMLGVLPPGEVPLTVSVFPGWTVYEFALPKAAVSPFVLKAGSTMPWNLLVNLNNGSGRLGWLEIAPGIGGAKNPALFPTLLLLP